MTLFEERVSPAALVLSNLFAVYFLFDVMNYVSPVSKLLKSAILLLPVAVLLVVLIREQDLKLDMLGQTSFMLFGLSCAVTTLVTHYIYVRSWLVIMPLALLLWYVVLPAAEFGRNDLCRLLKVILAIGFVYCAINFLINMNMMFGFWEAQDPYKNNLQGIYENKNTWGQLMMVFIFLAMCFVKGFPEYKWQGCGMLLVFIYTLAASLSRAAILAVLIFFILELFFSLSETNLKRILLAFCVISLGLILLWNLPSLQHLWHDYFFRSQQILSYRDDLWTIARWYWPEIPFWGYGFGAQVQLLGAYGVKLGAFHNNYIDWYMQGGIICLVVNLLIWGNCFYQSLKLYKIKKPVGAVFLAAFMALAIYCNFEYVTFYMLSMIDCLFCLFFLALPRLLFRLARNDIMGT